MVCSVMKCQCGKHYLAQRYIFALMAFMAITLSYNHRVCLNLLMSKMVIKPNDTEEGASPTETTTAAPPTEPSKKEPIQGGVRDWNTQIQGITKLAFYIGYVGFHIPGGMLSDTIGGRIPMISAVAASTVLCFVTPFSVFIGDWWLLSILRLIMGGCQALLYPAISTLLANWVPKKQRSFWSTFAFSGAHVGTIVGQTASGFIVDYWNSWPFVFYFWAVITVPWIVVAVFWVFSYPRTHKFITDEEKTFLEENIPIKSSKSIPWKEIASDYHIWAVVVGQIAHSWMFFTLNTDLPNYLANVMHFDIKANGVLSSLPFFALWVASVICGKIADVLIGKGMPVIWVRRGGAIIGNILASIILVIVPYLGQRAVLVMVIFVSCMVLKGAYYCSIRINHLDMSVHFAGILSAFINGIGAISGAITPYVIGNVAKDQKQSQWELVFYINCAISTSLTLIYVFFTTGDRANWDTKFDE